MLYDDQTVLNAESVMDLNLTRICVRPESLSCITLTRDTDTKNFTSGGGFSNNFARPWYQERAVSNYFATAMPPYPYYNGAPADFNATVGLYNRLGRAYPDVSANGAKLLVYNNGTDRHWYARRDSSGRY